MGGLELKGMTQDSAPIACIQETLPDLGSTLYSRGNIDSECGAHSHSVDEARWGIWCDGPIL